MPPIALRAEYIDRFLSGKASMPAISLEEAHESLQKRTCRGAEYLGWIDQPLVVTDEFLSEIQSFAQSIRNGTDVFIVCGIGGSYLGARALIEALGVT